MTTILASCYVWDGERRIFFAECAGRAPLASAQPPYRQPMRMVIREERGRDVPRNPKQPAATDESPFPPQHRKEVPR
jgi:hypothetical protein